MLADSDKMVLNFQWEDEHKKTVQAKDKLPKSSPKSAKIIIQVYM